MWLDCCTFICMSEERTQEGWPWCVVCWGVARVSEQENTHPVTSGIRAMVAQSMVDIVLIVAVDTGISKARENPERAGDPVLEELDI